MSIHAFEPTKKVETISPAEADLRYRAMLEAQSQPRPNGFGSQMEVAKDLGRPDFMFMSTADSWEEQRYEAALYRLRQEAARTHSAFQANSSQPIEAHFHFPPPQTTPIVTLDDAKAYIKTQRAAAWVAEELAPMVLALATAYPKIRFRSIDPVWTSDAKGREQFFSLATMAGGFSYAEVVRGQPARALKEKREHWGAGGRDRYEYSDKPF